MAETPALPAGRAVAWDDRVQLWRDGAVVLGGAPWGVLRIADPGREFVRRLRAAAAAGVVPAPGIEHALASLLVGRGIAHPVAVTGSAPPIDVVIPVYDQPDQLGECLAALRAASPAAHPIVVDDASSSTRVAEVAQAHGATLLRHSVNRGPAAARNTGLRHSTSAIVACVDADCAVGPGWLEVLIPHFDDPRVGAVAPRIRARPEPGAGLLGRYQQDRSALDMGPRPELVTHGAALGFLPSATILLRRSSTGPEPFDERMRVGEDVDLVWRLIDTGHLVRYEPAAVVSHAMRVRPLRWARRIFDYGTSAAALDRRHPGRLAPARLSALNLAAAAALLTRRPPGVAGALVASALAVGLLARNLRAAGVDPAVAPLIAGKGFGSDAIAVGHLLRREWWPIGWWALTARRSPVGAAAAAAMLVPLVQDWLGRRPLVDMGSYVALRLAEDAAYGSGVIVSAARSARWRALLPAVRLPSGRRRGG